MARNKYPEITVEKILAVSKKLFFEKGYDETTIQDIVNELDGLTKGAIYHHFKSKEEILMALGDKIFFDNNPFDSVSNRTDLNGLEKMRLAILLNQTDENSVVFSDNAMPALKNPRILAGMIESNRDYISPQWHELIEEGNRDGSINTEYAKELSEVLPLLNVWLVPSIFPASAEETLHKFKFLKKLFDDMGVSLIDDEVMNSIEQRSSSLVE